MTGQSARVAIIGGGAVGTSVQFHLARDHGITDTVLFEKDQLGSGSTSKAAGGIRNVFTNPANVRLGNRSLDYFRSFEAETGHPLEFHDTGYMYVYHSEEAERHWRDLRDSLVDLDVSADILSPDEVAEAVPPLDPTEIRGGLYAADCGRVDPHSVTQAFGKATADLGATVHTKTAVTDVRTRDGEVHAVESEAGTYEVDHVVNAAGPWAPAVGRMVGVEVPIELLLRRIMVTSDVGHGNCPLVIDEERECYFETERNGSMLVCDMAADDHDLAVPDGVQADDVGYDYYLSTLEKVADLVPVLRDLEVINGWAGIQSHSPDGNAIVGPTTVDGFLVACGFSGHGIQQSPLFGMAVAELVADGTASTVDLAPFGIDRFDGARTTEPEGLA